MFKENVWYTFAPGNLDAWINRPYAAGGDRSFGYAVGYNSFRVIRMGLTTVTGIQLDNGKYLDDDDFNMNYLFDNNDFKYMAEAAAGQSELQNLWTRYSELQRAAESVLAQIKSIQVPK